MSTHSIVPFLSFIATHPYTLRVWCIVQFRAPKTVHRSRSRSIVDDIDSDRGNAMKIFTYELRVKELRFLAGLWWLCNDQVFYFFRISRPLSAVVLLCWLLDSRYLTSAIPRTCWGGNCQLKNPPNIPRSVLIPQELLLRRRQNKTNERW